MSETARAVHATAPVERRAAAIEAALEAQGWKAGPQFLKTLADWLNFLKSRGVF